MSNWIVVNGAKIDKEFFEQNVAEAQSYHWHRKQWDKQGDHTHCIICGITIPTSDDKNEPVYYQSEGGWLCGYCFENFIHK
jgi:hypothetical protein